MSGRDPRSMRQRDERAHPVIKKAFANGHLESGDPFAIGGFANHEAANQGRLSVGRGLTHHNLARAAWVTDQDGSPCYQDCGAPDAPHGVHFRLIAKKTARTYIYRQTGGDPAKLKYNPFARRKQVALDDDGKPLQG